MPMLPVPISSQVAEATRDIWEQIRENEKDWHALEVIFKTHIAECMLLRKTLCSQINGLKDDHVKYQVEAKDNFKTLRNFVLGGILISLVIQALGGPAAFRMAAKYFGIPWPGN